ncbi:MAG: HAMP domain-containing histidine kinase, partial [Oscillospiraceae bacterium]|nr:HAMP domain-containing histidine kinase [Oscillospiraceae bacterium]
MKAFKRLCICMLLLFAVIAVGTDLYLFGKDTSDNGYYRVEAKRLASQIAQTGSMDLSGYRYLTGVYEDEGDIYRSDEHYVIIRVDERLYRVEYRMADNTGLIAAANISIAAAFLVTAGIMLYIYLKVIVPISRLTEVPKELAKGDLAAYVPQEKSRYLGDLTWSMDMMRESIEKSRERELNVQKEKKLLLLSLSHDIKTPLAAIKLNAKALEKGLYRDEEKRRSAAASIASHADEIEEYMEQITQAAGEDLMEFDIRETEGFIGPVIAKIRERYSERLASSGTELVIGEFDDVLLSCDPDRIAECIQNLMENA